MPLNREISHNLKSITTCICLICHLSLLETTLHISFYIINKSFTQPCTHRKGCATKNNRLSTFQDNRVIHYRRLFLRNSATCGGSIPFLWRRGGNTCAPLYLISCPPQPSAAARARSSRALLCATHEVHLRARKRPPPLPRHRRLLLRPTELKGEERTHRVSR